jgi:hypothetical protein
MDRKMIRDVKVEVAEGEADATCVALDEKRFWSPEVARAFLAEIRGVSPEAPPEASEPDTRLEPYERVRS